MNKVISILFITFFYSSYSFSICKFNPYTIGNVYIPDQTVLVQYDSSETILKVIDIPITSNTFSYSTNDSNSCNFTFSTGWFHWVYSPGTYQVKPTNIPGVALTLQLVFSSPQMGSGAYSVYYHNPTPPKYFSFTYMAWKLTIKRVGTINQSGVFPAGELAYNRAYSQTLKKSLDAGNLHFRSNFRILVANCGVKNSTLNIDLGDWYDTQFPTVGSTSREVDIPITLSCLAGTNIKATVTGTSGVVNSAQGQLALSGADKATGIAIQLIDADKNPIPLGSKQTIKNNVAAGEHIFGWKARYIKTADKVTPGSANGTATINIRYE
ncbi:TPA: fimbrial protein [Providencia alcalifaciens]